MEQMRGKEVDTANMNSSSRCVARGTDEARMVVAGGDFGGLGLGAFVRNADGETYPHLLFLSLLTLVLGSMRLTPYLLMAIKRISGKFGSVVC